MVAFYHITAMEVMEDMEATEDMQATEDMDIKA